MPVNRDLNLYAKWNSNKLVEYTIRYKLNDENGVEIAAETKGSALAGTTKTFDAKIGSELNEGYRSGYFPHVGSHSITMDINGNNVFTFIYTKVPEVNYTVRYLEKDTNVVLHEEKKATTSDAVITEKFEPVAGYAPDAYQKRLVLSVNEEKNVLIFWYVADTEHAPVQIIHWTQNIAGDGYTEYQSSTNLNGEIRKEYSETPLTIDGFEYNANPAHPVDGYPALASGTLTEAGLVLNLYYDRIEYPYAFKFLEQGTDKELADPISGAARYQAQVTQTAKPIPGYTLASPENQAINIAIEDGTTAVKNVKTFYYTEQSVDIKYQVVGPTGCGTLDNYQESQLKVITGEVKGSTPTPNPGFKFVGWYTSSDCQFLVKDVMADAVDSTTNKLTPQKRANGCHYEWTYYAKFEYDTFDLTIKKEGLVQNIGKVDVESAIFTVSGGNQTWTVVCDKDNNYRVTLTGLKCGTEYTVTEQNGWTWRYNETKSEKFTYSGGSEKILTFTNAFSNPHWLGGDNFKTNVFGTSTGN